MPRATVALHFNYTLSPALEGFYRSTFTGAPLPTPPRRQQERTCQSPVIEAAVNTLQPGWTGWECVRAWPGCGGPR